MPATSTSGPSLRPLEIVRLTAIPALLALFGVALTMTFAWPYWQENPITGVFAALLPAWLMGVGWIVVRSSGTAPGTLLLVAALFASMSWAGARNTSWWPVIGEITQVAYYVTVAAALLLYRRTAPNRRDFMWCAGAIAALGLTQAVFFTESPTNFGYAANVVWFNGTNQGPLSPAQLGLAAGLHAVVAISFVWLLIARRNRHADHQHSWNWLRPAVAVVAVIAFITSQIVLVTSPPTLAEAMRVRAIQTLAVGTIPLGVFAYTILDHWRRHRAVLQITALQPHPTHTGLQGALRTIWADPTLRLWIRAMTRYENASGALLSRQGMVSVAQKNSGRTHIFYDHDNEVVAVGIFANERTDSARLWPALDNACAPILRNLTENLCKVENERRISRRILKSEHSTRTEIAGRLHDTVQQSLNTLSWELPRLRNFHGHIEEPIRVQLDQQIQLCQKLCIQALEDLLDISRNVAPRVLTTNGLRAAVDEALCDVQMTTRLQVPEQRWHTEVEHVMYYAIRECIANAQKYSGADQLAIVADADDDHLKVVVQDDGTGGAEFLPGRGLSRMRARLAAVGGTVDVRSSASEGTAITLSVGVYATE